MPTYTPNYKLIRHEGGDLVTNTDLNKNWDKIDAAIDGLSKSVDSRTTATQSDVVYEAGYVSSAAPLIRKWGRVVQVSMGVSGTFDTSVRTIGTLPTGYTPTAVIYGAAVNSIGDTVGLFSINGQGKVSVRMSKATNSAFFTAAYVAAIYDV